jgi:hypothetical protein
VTLERWATGQIFLGSIPLVSERLNHTQTNGICLFIISYLFFLGAMRVYASDFLLTCLSNTFWESVLALTHIDRTVSLPPIPVLVVTRSVGFS